jgi:AcrR family transcriptional regulator
MSAAGFQSERREQRQRQILAAAETSFRQLGFHGASVAEIATRAAMSVGQIYRYFPSKEALIEALVRQDMDRRLVVMHRVIAERPDDIFAALAAHSDIGMDLALDPDRRALILEIAAEAARNPRVRALTVQASESALAVVREHLEQVRPPGWSAAEMNARLELVGALFEGLAFQATLRDTTITPEIRALMAETVQRLMTA